MIVWSNGAFLEADAACFAVDDRGTLGDGLFETVRVEDGGARRWARHMARLEEGLARLGFAGLGVASVDLRDAVEGTAARNGLAHAAARLTVTRGSGPRGLAPPTDPSPRVLVTVAPAAPAPGPRRLAEADVRRAPGSVAASCKTLSYADNVAALAEARARGGDDALVLDAHGKVSGAAAANVFWLAGGRVFTPALSGAVLPGVTRAAIVAAAEVEEGDFDLDALLKADAAFLTNALTGVAPVAGIVARDGARAEFDADHPKLKELQALERAAP